MKDGHRKLLPNQMGAESAVGRMVGVDAVASASAYAVPSAHFAD